MARGVAGWWEELEFSMAAPQEEANPREKRVNGGEPVSCRATERVGGSSVETWGHRMVGRLWEDLGSQGNNGGSMETRGITGLGRSFRNAK